MGSWPELEQSAPAASNASSATGRFPCALIRQRRCREYRSIGEGAVRADKDAHGAAQQTNEEPDEHAQHQRALQRAFDQEAAFDVGRIRLHTDTNE